MAEKYLVVQMGLSAFVWDPTLDDFRAHTWNIHIFPSAMVRPHWVAGRSSVSTRGGLTSVSRQPPPPPPKKQVERIVACDASSLSFLREHGLDFNAWVDGVPFLALEQEASLRKQIEDQVGVHVSG